MRKEYDPEIMNDYLPIYYRHLFPYEPYCKWLGAGNVDKTFLGRSEFCFNDTLRYQSFANHDDFQKELIKRLPHRIDIGAVYNYRPCDRKNIDEEKFQPQEKELVFDIDMNDYDDIRTCCEGASICNKCWQFMTVAIKILDRALREDFGFKHMLWVYSGRRGIHCWVSDPTACRLDQSGRSAVAEYLQVLRGSNAQTKKVKLCNNAIHPSIIKSLDIIKGSFERLCLEDQDILGEPARWNKVLALIPDADLRHDLGDIICGKSNSIEHWDAMKSYISRKLSKRGKSLKPSQHILEEIMLQFAYPRLDIAVSKGLNHLLKSPFSIHPKTGRVCIPIDPSKAEFFNPMTVPTISQLVSEIEKFVPEQKEKIVSKGYKKTSLREPVEIFEEFLSKLRETWKRKLIEATLNF